MPSFFGIFVVNCQGPLSNRLWALGCGHHSSASWYSHGFCACGAHCTFVTTLFQLCFAVLCCTLFCLLHSHVLTQNISGKDVTQAMLLDFFALKDGAWSRSLLTASAQSASTDFALSPCWPWSSNITVCWSSLAFKKLKRRQIPKILWCQVVNASHDL